MCPAHLRSTEKESPEFATPTGNGHLGAALPAYGQLSSEPAHSALLRSNNLQAAGVGTRTAMLITGQAHESHHLENGNEQYEGKSISRVFTSVAGR
jgi:hypothetical protein